MSDLPPSDPERERLREAREHGHAWRRWGPYLSERQWGTVREDYSADGDAWRFFPHDHARSRTYRWGEDGLLGICDDLGRLCFALALWNEADPFLKERLFGVTNPEGNHGEDVKEVYAFLDNVPTHAYMKALYRYPQRPFPYGELVAENVRRSRTEPEYELVDTGAFAADRYFDVVVEYAKAGPHDLVIRVSATNRGPAPAPLHVLPTLWFRNTWSWGRDPRRPTIQTVADAPPGTSLVLASHRSLGTNWLACQGAPTLLFTENETNRERLWRVPNPAPYVKDGIHDAVVAGRADAVNPAGTGTKVAAHYVATIATGATATFLLRLSDSRHDDPFADALDVLATRQAEADAFYVGLPGASRLTPDQALVHRQALAGLLWSKQFYDYDVPVWLDGDPAGPTPPPERLSGRNSGWRHVNNGDVLLMPDTWEYPWFAAWDLAFHCVALAEADPDFAKHQLVLLLREWYMHPNGQLPAYEWDFGDVNPPVHAWAALHVYQAERRVHGAADRAFLERVFHKLLLNFTWWVNREDAEGNNVFEGGFLGLDNVGVFDRSAPAPLGGRLEQADGTAWMGMFCLNMLAIALELANDEPAYEDVATKFFEHFLAIAGALNNLGGRGVPLWDEQDEFFYDVLHLPSGEIRQLKVRSLVGLLPLLAVTTIEPELLEKLPSFSKRLEWYLTHRPELASLVSRWHEPGVGDRRLLALVRGHRMKRLLARMLDPGEFLGKFGIRSLSRYHLDHPYSLKYDGIDSTVRYDPAESDSPLFGGNSNWRGPIWMPANYLLIEAIRRFHGYYGDDFRVECPTGSGTLLSLAEVADELARRLSRIFLLGADGRRPFFGSAPMYQSTPSWRDAVLFYEYFHGDNGAGLGAAHQTGWTALVAPLLTGLA